MPDAAAVHAASQCPQCGTALAPGLLSCPGCQRLVYADVLKTLAADAERATRAGDLSGALACWQRALELLPPDSRQYETIAKLAGEIGCRLEATAVGAPAAPPTQPGAAPQRKTWGLVAAAGAALVFLLTKAKWLALGLSKMGTLWTMLLSFGVYWTAWGWQFALGFVLSIYVHEMGHVAALRRYGIPATAPMFIPGLGAFVRMKQNPPTPAADADVGLAGPRWGLGAACATYLLLQMTGNPLFAALTDTGALINLFNLIPLGPLDGGRGFKAMCRWQRWLTVLALLAAYVLTSHGLLILLGIFAVLHALSAEAPEKPGHSAFLWYVFLVAALLLLAHVAAPMAAAAGVPGGAAEKPPSQ